MACTFGHVLADTYCTGTAIVRRTIRLWSGLRTLARQRRVQLALSVRVTAAALLSFTLAQLLQLPLPLWAALTAVIVTQMSVGRSLKATADYLLGTVGGAIYGAAITVLVPHTSELALLFVLGLSIGPMAFLAAVNPRFSAAPITAILVVLIPIFTHASPIVSAFDRIIEVALGGVTGLAVSFLLFPSNAHLLVAAAAALALDRMALALDQLLAGLTKGLDMDALHRIQDGIGQALVQLNAMGTEANHERSARLVTGPDTGPLLRTLLRLRHDLVMIGRAATDPLPQPLLSRLESPLRSVRSALMAYLQDTGSALQSAQPPPPPTGVDNALNLYDAEVEALRREGLTRSLPSDAAERFFALGFALEQMHNDLKDLERCVVEWAAPSDQPGPDAG